MSHKKGQGTSRNGRDSNAKRLGVKKFFVSAARAIILDPMLESVETTLFSLLKMEK